MSRFGELCTMENEMKIHSQLDETKLKLDSSSLYDEVAPTGPRPAQCVSERSHASTSLYNTQSLSAPADATRPKKVGLWP